METAPKQSRDGDMLIDWDVPIPMDDGVVLRWKHYLAGTYSQGPWALTVAQNFYKGYRDGNDLKRLREFVSVFGPYFHSGAEAQFLLADKLLDTNNEADAREAQTYLAQLRVTADEPVVRARATEALARLMVKNQLMEDAVGLYLQLGKEYPKVVVRDGKTGADFMTSLLTDKRLLPYLEPSRYPMPTRVKAEQREPAPNQNYGAAFEIEPGGDHRRPRAGHGQQPARPGAAGVRLDLEGGQRGRQGRGLALAGAQRRAAGRWPDEELALAHPLLHAQRRL